MAIRRSFINHRNVPYVALGIVFVVMGYLGPSMCAYEDGTGGLGTAVVGIVLFLFALLENGIIR